MSYSRAWAFLGLKSVLLYRWSHNRIFPKTNIRGSRTIIKSMETHRHGPSRRCVLSTGCFNVFWLSSLNIDKEPFKVRPSTKPQALRVPGRTSKVGTLFTCEFRTAQRMYGEGIYKWEAEKQRNSRTGTGLLFRSGACSECNRTRSLASPLLTHTRRYWVVLFWVWQNTRPFVVQWCRAPTAWWHPPQSRNATVTGTFL